MKEEQHAERGTWRCSCGKEFGRDTAAAYAHVNGKRRLHHRLQRVLFRLSDAESHFGGEAQ